MLKRKTSRLARIGGPVVLIKTGLTLTAFAAAAYSRWLGRKLEAAGVVDTIDGVELTDDVAAKLRRQKMLNRVIPLLSGGLVIVGAVEGERGRSNSGSLAKVIDTVGIDKSTLDKVGTKISDTFHDTLRDTKDKVDGHNITPDFVQERRLPDALAKLAS
jgi:hypothetical protein